jgi:hypothetical protein
MPPMRSPVGNPPDGPELLARPRDPDLGVPESEGAARACEVSLGDGLGTGLGLGVGAAAATGAGGWDFGGVGG